MECTRKQISLASDRCLHVTKHCEGESQYLNVLKFHYCYLDGYPLVTVGLCAFAMLLLMRHIGHVSDQYLSRAISSFSKMLKLSELIAGATLLSFSNGATDIITAIVGATSGDGEGMDMVLGSLFGASSFAVLCILAGVILMAPVHPLNLKEAQVELNIAFFLFADGILLIAGLLSWPIGLVGMLFWVIYGIYIWSLISKARKNSQQAKETIQEVQLGVSNSSSMEETFTTQDSEQTVDNEDVKIQAGTIAVQPLETSKEEDSIQTNSDSQQYGENQTESTSQINVQKEDPPITFKSFAQLIDHFKKFKRPIDKILFALDQPQRLLTSMVIPAVNDQVYLWKQPKLCYLLAVVALFLVQSPSMWALAAVGAMVYFLIAKNHRDNSLTIVGSLMMLNFLVKLVFDLLGFVKVAYGLSPFFLSLTILGVANSVVDLFVDCALSKQGLFTMAVAGVFSGQLFNYLVGLGLTGIIETVQSLTKETSSGAKSTFGEPVFPKGNRKMVCSILIAHMVILGSILGWLRFRNFTATKGLAFLLICFYVCLFAALVFMEIHF